MPISKKQREVSERFYTRVLKEADMYVNINRLIDRDKVLAVWQNSNQHANKEPNVKRAIDEIAREGKLINDGFIRCAQELNRNRFMDNTETKTAFSRFGPKLVCMIFQLSTIASGMGFSTNWVKGAIPSVQELKGLGKRIEQSLNRFKDKGRFAEINEGIPGLAKTSLDKVAMEKELNKSVDIGMKAYEKALKFNKLSPLEKDDIVSQSAFLTANAQTIGLGKIDLGGLQAMFSQPGLFEQAMDHMRTTSLATPILHAFQHLVQTCIAVMVILQKEGLLELEEEKRTKTRGKQDSFEEAFIDSFNKSSSSNAQGN